MTSRSKAKAWEKWRASSRTSAEGRWRALDALERPMMSGEDWLDETRRSLIRLADVGILGAREQQRVKQLEFRHLASADQDRLKKAEIAPRHLFAFSLAADRKAPDEPLTSGSPQLFDEPLSSRSLRLNDGRKLRDGRLSLQVFIDETRKLPIGMNIQLRGVDPHRERPCYLRYDLDVVAMGEKAGPVTHFRAHWHAGDDPDHSDAEDHDPRLPSLILDPLAVLDVLIETFFPNGPTDVVKS